MDQIIAIFTIQLTELDTYQHGAVYNNVFVDMYTNQLTIIISVTYC